MTFEIRITNYEYEIEFLKLLRNTDRWKNCGFSYQFFAFFISYTKK